MKYTVFTQQEGLLGLDCAGYPVYNTRIRNNRTTQEMHQYIAKCLTVLAETINAMENGVDDLGSSLRFDPRLPSQINQDVHPRSWMDRYVAVAEWCMGYPDQPLTTALIDDFNTVVLSVNRRMGATPRQLKALRIQLNTRELVYDSNRRTK